MEGDALAREQLRVDGFAGERVTKGEALGRFLHDELRRDELLDMRQQRTLVEARERLKKSEIESPAGDRGFRRDVTRRHGKRRQAAAHGLDGRTWHADAF